MCIYANSTSFAKFLLRHFYRNSCTYVLTLCSCLPLMWSWVCKYCPVFIYASLPWHLLTVKMQQMIRPSWHAEKHSGEGAGEDEKLLGGFFSLHSIHFGNFDWWGKPLEYSKLARQRAVQIQKSTATCSETCLRGCFGGEIVRILSCVGPIQEWRETFVKVSTRNLTWLLIFQLKKMKTTLWYNLVYLTDWRNLFFISPHKATFTVNSAPLFQKQTHCI